MGLVLNILITGFINVYLLLTVSKLKERIEILEYQLEKLKSQSKEP